MILTCPNCATRYLVEDSDMRAEGRAVRCSSCGEEWRAASHEAEAEPELAEQLTGAPLEAEAPSESLVAPPPQRERDVEAKESPIVAPIATHSRAPRGAGPGAALGLIVLVVIILAVCAFAFRREIVRMWPGAAPLYSALGAPVSAMSRPHG